MARKKYCFGNWKMNQGIKEIEEFQKAFRNYPENLSVGLSPQTMHLERAINFFKGTGVLIGSQDCSYEDSGAYTGENSPKFLRELGVNFTLVGHSERRQYFSETSSSCLKKIKKALENKLIVVYCIGENLEEFESGKTAEVLNYQLQEGILPLLKQAKIEEKVVIAYEPVWAIGTGKTATSETIQSSLKSIRDALGEYGEKISLLYGGSVKPSNSSEISQTKHVDGVLVGGASLDADSFSQIAQSFA